MFYTFLLFPRFLRFQGFLFFQRFYKKNVGKSTARMHLIWMVFAACDQWLL